MRIQSLLTLFAFAAADETATKILPAVGDELCTGSCQTLGTTSRMNRVMPLIASARQKCEAEHKCPAPKMKAMAGIPCSNGKAGEYGCNGVDLESFVPLSELGSGRNGEGNDIWGWTDAGDGNREYAIFCATDGTSFVDVTDAKSPKVVAWLPTATVSSIWRDVKVYKDHAYVVSEARDHGMQVVDMTKFRQLRMKRKRSTITADVWYREFGNSHNIVMNEDTGYAYSVGTRTCSGGLHMVDVRDPKNPTFAGCGDVGQGYSHDSQCVVYSGPDSRYTGQEICFNYNEDKLVISDVTVKNAPVLVSVSYYQDDQYTHQGWLTADQSMLLMNDELDELYGKSPNTRTLIWDVTDLRNPRNTASHYSDTTVIDHNLYIHENGLGYLSNYCDGLVLLDATQLKNGVAPRVGSFDVAPDCNTVTFSGSWSNYPYFKSGTIIVSSIERGLFSFKVQPRVLEGVAKNNNNTHLMTVKKNHKLAVERYLLAEQTTASAMTTQSVSAVGFAGLAFVVAAALAVFNVARTRSAHQPTEVYTSVDIAGL